MTNSPNVFDHCMALQRSLEQYETALAESQHRIELLETDIQEWYDTFKEYGATPDSCLHTLLSRADGDTMKRMQLDESVLSRARAWDAVWNLLLAEGGMDVRGNHDGSGQAIVCETIRSLIKQSRKRKQRKGRRENLLKEREILRTQLANANSQCAALNQRICIAVRSLTD